MTQGDWDEQTDMLPVEKAFSIAAKQIFSGLGLDKAQVPTLYHYTDQDGLLGIVKKNCMWATNVKCLNDRSEVLHGFRTGLSALEDYKVTTKFDPWQNAIDSLKSYLRDYVKGEERGPGTPSSAVDFAMQPYVACFCQEADSLSQWRAYSSGGGYALHFKFGSVRPNLVSRYPNKAWILQRVLYDENEQMDSLRSVLSEVDKVAAFLEEGQLDLGGHSPIEFLSLFLQSFFIPPLYAFKDKAFKSESEWRLVLNPPALFIHLPTDLPDFRASKIGPVPYLEASPKDGKLPISGVTCGPTLDREVAEDCVRLLLARYGFRDYSVNSSPIPLRF